MKDQQCFALVTGATSGIGQALCYLFADRGINLIAVGRDEERLHGLQAELQSKVTVIPVRADLSTKNGREPAIRKLHEYSPKYVINNAGLGLYGDCLTYSTEDQMNLL